jgi:hypothetical protein
MEGKLLSLNYFLIYLFFENLLPASLLIELFCICAQSEVVNKLFWANFHLEICLEV